MPYSGPASAYGVIGRTEAAYFKMINEQGGVNGRKINLISLDDGYSPPKTVEQVRRLVEDEKVAFLFQTLGTAPIWRSGNISTTTRFRSCSSRPEPARSPTRSISPGRSATIPNYRTEARIYGRHILANTPNGKIAVLYQNDGFGKDYLIGLKSALGDKAGSMIVKEASYETSEPTIDSQIVTLQGSGADVLIIAATPKFAAQAIRKSYDLGWNAVRYLSNVSPSIATVLKPAGLEKSKGLITGGYVMDVNDPRWKDQPSMHAWKAFTDKFMSATEYGDANAAYAFGAASTLIQVLKQCEHDLTRENVMKQAANVKAFAAPMLIPGITVDTSPTEFSPIRKLQLLTFDGTTWQITGGILQG